MQIQSLALQNIRSHQSYNLHFSKEATVIVGPNASGKTTVVEAIHVLATGDSFRAGKIEEMVSMDAELGRITGKIETEQPEFNSDEGEATEEDTVEIMLNRGMVQGKRTAKRLYSVNGVRRRRKDAVNKFYTVVFRPEDMRLIEGSPSRRRTFLNDALSPLNADYARSLKTYDQTLIRRNRLLSQIQEGKQSRSSLQYWTLTLLKHGQVLQKQRKDFLGTYNHLDFPLLFSVRYMPSVISEDRITQYIDREIVAGHTLIGPHKDDFEVTLTKINQKGAEEPWVVSTYGSRGEQRMGVLWLKFGQLQFIVDKTGQKPVWLLDDILSELDDESQKRVLSALDGHQTIITTTDAELISTIKEYANDVAIVELTA